MTDGKPELDASDKPDAVLEKPDAEDAANDLEHDKFLWDVIKRLDFYIGTTNTKAAFLIPFNVFVITSVILKYKDWPEFLGPGHSILLLLGQATLVLIALASIFSLIPTFLTVNPFMKGGGAGATVYRSLLFYAHIAKMKESEYAAAVRSLGRSRAVTDMAYQAHVLSVGVTGKFWLLRVATGAVVIELCGLALLIFFKCIQLLQFALKLS
jgi:hypothetical protein